MSPYKLLYGLPAITLVQWNLTHHFALIIKRDAQRLLMMFADQAEPVTVSVADFARQITGDFLMVRKAEDTVADDGNTVSASNAV